MSWPSLARDGVELVDDVDFDEVLGVMGRSPCFCEDGVAFVLVCCTESFPGCCYAVADVGLNCPDELCYEGDAGGYGSAGEHNVTSRNVNTRKGDGVEVVPEMGTTFL